MYRGTVMDNKPAINMEITDDMIAAGIDANLLNRGVDMDSDELVIEIYRAMESVRRTDREVSANDHLET